jgi:hypothetical protein
LNYELWIKSIIFAPLNFILDE